MGGVCSRVLGPAPQGMVESNYGFLGLAKVTANGDGWVMEEGGGCLREEAWRVGRRAQVTYLSVNMD